METKIINGIKFTVYSKNKYKSKQIKSKNVYFVNDVFVDDNIKCDYIIGNGDIIFKGIKTKNILRITNLKWNVYVLDTHIKIGCKFYSREEWENFSDREINSMDIGALKFWRKYKDMILGIKFKNQE